MILALVLTYPERSLRDLFAALQHHSPGGYQPSHLETFQRGVRKIRARLHTLMEEPWPDEVIQGPVPTMSWTGSTPREQQDEHLVHAVALPSAFLPKGWSQEQAQADDIQMRHPSLIEQETRASRRTHLLVSNEMTNRLTPSQNRRYRCSFPRFLQFVSKETRRLNTRL